MGSGSKNWLTKANSKKWALKFAGEDTEKRRAIQRGEAHRKGAANTVWRYFLLFGGTIL